MKIFTATALLENGLIHPDEPIDCHGGRFTFFEGTAAARPIKDSHGLGVVPIRTAFAESSNVAFVTLGLRLAPHLFYDQLRRFRFGMPTGIDLPYEEIGMVPLPHTWDPGDEHVSISFGYGLSMTALQVASAVAAIANEGRYMRPHVVKEIHSPRGELLERTEPEQLGVVCRPDTSRMMLDMMEHVVLEGTGTTATLAGYRVGGKTGTCIEKFGGEKRYISSFAGVLPIEDPRLVIYAWIRWPQGAKYGSTVAAPVVRDIARHATRIMGVKPTWPTEPKRPATLIAQDDAAARPKEEFPPNVMPDLTGLTIREVASSLKERGVPARLDGWGLAVGQDPPAGSPLPLSTPGCVYFAPPNPDWE